jgi:hypothetical protein
MVKAIAPLPLIFLPESIAGSAVKRRFKSLTSDSQLPSSITLKNGHIYIFFFLTEVNKRNQIYEVETLLPKGVPDKLEIEVS